MRAASTSSRVTAAETPTEATKELPDGTRPAAAIPFFPIYYNDVYEVNLPPNHRFPMDKYRQVRERVQEYVRNSLRSTDQRPKVRCEFRVSPLATVEELETTHDPEYVGRFLTGHMTEQEQRNVGFPWSPDGVRRARSSVGGTVAAACAVAEEWLSRRRRQQQKQRQRQDGDGNNSGDITAEVMAPWGAHVAGGTHHAFFDRGEGFSVFSDIAVAANVVLGRYSSPPTAASGNSGIDGIRKILIVDLDVHQGNGNAELFRDRPEVFTFSMQCSANYFSEKQESDLDIELPPGCTDETYLMTLHHWLGRLQREVECDLIFFQAGVDVLEADRLGRFALSQSGVERRNDMVYRFARDLNVPLVITMGGGYPSDRDDWTPIIAAHSNVYIQAYQFLEKEADKLLATIGKEVSL